MPPKAVPYDVEDALTSWADGLSHGRRSLEVGSNISLRGWVFFVFVFLFFHTPLVCHVFFLVLPKGSHLLGLPAC